MEHRSGLLFPALPCCKGDSVVWELCLNKAKLKTSSEPLT
jgi:hypothetical protein